MQLDDLTNRFRFRNRNTAQKAANDMSGDFGLGSKVGRNPGIRLINQDGDFNVERRGASIFAPYQTLVEMSWAKFLILTFLAYVGLNFLFALGYLALGIENLVDPDTHKNWLDEFASAFFFSVQTFTTVGYGAIHPKGIPANMLSSVTAISGLLSVALATGLVFARFSRPHNQIKFSTHALIAPYRGKPSSSLQFRIANLRDNNLINMRANVVLSWLIAADDSGGLIRKFAPLELERQSVALFPLNWTIVHPINENSPIFGWSKRDFCRRHSEILIMIEGYDQTYAQTIHANSSYTYEEVIWNARFQPMYIEGEDRTILHLDRIDHIFEEE